jgi:hypothetical protein
MHKLSLSYPTYYLLDETCAALRVQINRVRTTAAAAIAAVRGCKADEDTVAAVISRLREPHA